MSSKSSAAAALVSLRWAKTTASERTAVAKMLNEAKARKAKKTATARTQTVRRRSRKPKTQKPQAE